MLSFAIAWQLWLRTHSAFALGMVGLVQVIPVILLSLPGGHVADQHNRRRIIAVAQAVVVLCAGALAVLSWRNGPILAMYGVLLVIGIARAFNDPASSTLLPMTVPPELFANAATWSSSAWQLAAISGPALAGVWVATLKSVTGIYVFDAGVTAAYLVLLTLIRGRHIPLARKAATLDSLKEGLRFMSATRIILAAITLDLFAVLFGGAVALLPIYATDVLKVGATGLGIMRAAPSVGALAMAFALAHRDPAPHFVRYPGEHEGGADDHADVVQTAEQREHAHREHEAPGQSEDDGGGSEAGHCPQQGLPSLFERRGGGVGTIIVVLVVLGVFPDMRKLRSLAPDS